jgi:hypothetical protein
MPQQALSMAADGVMLCLPYRRAVSAPHGHPSVCLCSTGCAENMRSHAARRVPRRKAGVRQLKCNAGGFVVNTGMRVVPTPLQQPPLLTFKPYTSSPMMGCPECAKCTRIWWVRPVTGRHATRQAPCTRSSRATSAAVPGLPPSVAPTATAASGATDRTCT